jgi:hypothetical protein
MRRWKVIGYGSAEEDHPEFSIGDILTLAVDDNTGSPNMTNGRINYYCNTDRLVEIDEQGKVIRTYKECDTLDGGTLVKEENGMRCSPVDTVLNKSASNRYVMAKYTNEQELNADMRKDFFILAAEVQRLRDEHAAQDVWKDAPLAAISAITRFLDEEGAEVGCSEERFRDRPKTLEQEIAEDLTDKFSENFCNLNANQKIELSMMLTEVLVRFKERTK